MLAVPHHLAHIVAATKRRRLGAPAPAAATVDDDAPALECLWPDAPPVAAKPLPAKPLPAKPARVTVAKRRSRSSKPVSRAVAFDLLMRHTEAVELITSAASVDALLVLRGVNRAFKVAADARADLRALVAEQMAALHAVPASVCASLHGALALDYVGFCVAGVAPSLDRMLAHDCSRLVARALRLAVRGELRDQPQAASAARRKLYDLKCYICHYFVAVRRLRDALDESGDGPLRARLLRDWLSERLASVRMPRPSEWVDEALESSGALALICQRAAALAARETHEPPL